MNSEQKTSVKKNRVKPEHEYPGIDNLDIMQSATNYNRFLARQVQIYSNGERHVLDFGAGIGSFSSMMRNAGHNVICVENDLQLYNMLIAKGFRTYRNLDEIQEDIIDYIFALNILEHIDQDLLILKQIHSLLKKGGRSYIFVPAFSILYSSMDRKVGHFRRYNVSTLIILAKKAGFIIEHIQHIDSLGFIASLLYKVFGNKRGDLNPASIKFYDKYVFPVSRAFDIVCNRFMGKNIEMVLVKPCN